MSAQLLAQLCGEECVAYLTHVQPSAATLNQSAVGCAVRELITICRAHLRDGAASIIYEVSLRSVHVFSAQLPQPSVVELVLADQGNLVCTVVAALIHVPCLHLSSLGVEILEGTLALNVRVETWVEAVNLLDATVAGIDEWCGVGEAARVLTVRILI